MGMIGVVLSLMALLVLAGSLVVLAVRNRNRRKGLSGATEGNADRPVGEAVPSSGDPVPGGADLGDGASEPPGAGRETQAPGSNLPYVSQMQEEPIGSRADSGTHESLHDQQATGNGAASELETVPPGEVVGTRRRDVTHRGGAPHEPTRDDNSPHDALDSEREVPSDTTPSEGSGEGEQPESRPRVGWVTWQAGGSYKVGVEISFEAETRVYAGEAELGAARGHPDFREATSLVPVRVSYEMSAGNLEEMTVEPDRFMFFKLGADNLGRPVRRLTRGTYLFLMPRGWSLVPETAAARVKVAVSGYAGWVLPVDGTSGAPAVRATDGADVPLPSDNVFTLSAPDFVSDMDKRGFYLCSPPVVHLASPCREQITIVVGEEGGGKRHPWRRAAIVVPGTSDCPLDSLLGSRAGGWFFVRVYDSQDVLLDSEQFVYLRDVKAIQMSGYQVLPGSSGHQKVAVHIVHGSDVEVEADCLESCPAPDGTRLAVPPDPSTDFVDVGIVPREGGKVQARLGLGRLWFQLPQGGAKADADAWTDSPVGLRLNDFETSKGRKMFVRVPPHVRPLKLAVGFEGGQPMPLAVSPGKREVVFPLNRLFADLHSRRASNLPLELKLWLDGEPGHCVMAIADPAAPTETLAAWGRSKSATAKASLWTCGTGQVTCDGHGLDRRHPTVDVGCDLLRKVQIIIAERPLPPGLDLSVTTYCKGYRTVRRSKAAAHAIARILAKMDPSLRPRLKREGLGGAGMARSVDNESEAADRKR